MKYLKISAAGIYATNEISKRDLIDVKQKSLEWLIDVTAGTYFDAEQNQWIKIQNV